MVLPLCSLLRRNGLLVALLLPLPLVAQTVARDASRRTESIGIDPRMTTLRTDVSLDSRGGTEFESFAPPSPGDYDIGEQLILRQKDKIDTFHGSVDSFLFWTDNAAQASAGEVSDWFWGWRAAADWQPMLSGKLAMPVGISQSMFRYDRYGVLDYEEFEANIGLTYIEPRLASTMFFVQYEFERLTHEFDEMMNSHSLRAGAQKIFLINRRSSIQAVVYGDWDIENDVDALKRNEYIANLIWRFKLTRKLELSVGYRYTYFDYSEFSRSDHLHLVDLGLVYTPRKWLQIYASASHNFNNSNYDVYDYDSSVLGFGVGLRIRF
jgi:hypothetical protein